jgi:predicted regulator of Ras-like GTPase activity (Roadblock/LC7/MglB family)
MYKQDELLKNAVEKLSPQPMEAAIVRLDGLVIDQYLLNSVDDGEKDRFVRMSTVMAALGERISAELELKTFEETIVRGSQGIVIALGKEEWILMAKFTTIASLDDTLTQLRKAADTLNKTIQIPYD